MMTPWKRFVFGMGLAWVFWGGADSALAGRKTPDDLEGYWRKTFADEFQGPPVGMDPKEVQRCYQVPPRCIDLYNTWDLPCSSNPVQSFPKLAKLNKCVWSVHRSVNWMSSNVNEFTADQVEVRENEENGILVLKGNSVFPNGTIRPRGGSSGTDFGDIGAYRQWMTAQGYDCAGADGKGQANPALRKCPLRSGMVTSISRPGRPWPGFFQQYGLLQVRGTVASGDQAWPAYWMLPDATWPGGGEFDLMESWNENKASQTFHTGVCIPNGEEDLFPDSCTAANGKARWHLSKGEDLRYQDTPTGNSFHSRYHNFSLEWNAQRITFRTDGAMTNRISQGDRIHGNSEARTLWDEITGNDKKPAHIPRRPFYFLLNHTVGGPDKGPNPVDFSEQQLKIDYVRAWQKCSIASDYCPRGGTFGTDGMCSGGPGGAYASPCTRCLYGGTGGNPNCQVKGLSSPEFNPGVEYWVDTNPRWPGVYYKKLGGDCPAGGTPSDGNCRVKSLSSAVTHVPVPGVQYWVDSHPSWPGIYYKQVSGACVYGGVASGNGNCQWKTLSGLKAGVSYWVDGNPRWPGVYYRGTQGSCPHGGVSSGNGNCQLQGYSVPAAAGITLRPGVQYWLDADPRWPGVYYKQIQGTCAVGGTPSNHGNCQLVAYALPQAPYLVRGQSYWADADPRWPGIYYRQIQGDCRYGGSRSADGNCQLLPLPQGLLEDQLNYFVDTNPKWPGVYYRAVY